MTAAGSAYPFRARGAANRKSRAEAVLALLMMHLGAWFAGPAVASTSLPPLPPVPAEPGTLVLDPVNSRVDFHLRTRWGQRIDGHLPVLGGERRILADGRHQVHIELDAAGIEVEDSDRLDAIARGEGFFDAAAHPRIVFLSDPYPAALVEHGGRVNGWLEIRGVRRPEALVLEPATCAAPGTGCPVSVHGRIDRSDYGMDAMRLTVTANVHLDLRLWLLESLP